MKRNKIIVVASALLLFTSISLVSCGNKKIENSSASTSSSHIHQSSGEWEYDANYHYHQCECGELIDKAEHSFVNDVCSVCNYERVVSKGLQMYLKEDNTYAVIDCGECEDENISIPSVYNGLAVTSIEESCFAYNEHIKSVEIPDSITYIGEYAFNQTTSLASLSLGKNVEYIGASAFSGNVSLTSVTLPEKTKVIENYAFSYCISLTDVKLSDNLEYLGDEAFSDISKSFNYNVDANGKYIGSEENKYLAFVGLVDEKVTSFTVNENTKFILDRAFLGCSSLTKLSIPDSIKSIGNRAFSNNNNYELHYYNNAYYIGNEKNKYLALYKVKNKYITSITVHENTKFILDRVFEEHDKLQEVSLGNNLVQIGEYAFFGATSLKTINLPSSLRMIESSAFYSCTSLTSISLNDDIRYLGVGAFYNCKSLNKVDLPDELHTINHFTFNGCTSLEEVTFGTKLKKISNHAFNNTALKSIILPNSIRIIDDYAFAYCSSLTSVQLNKGIWSIGNNSFDKTASFISKYENGYYLGDKDNAYRILLSMDEVDEVKMHKDIEIIASRAFLFAKDKNIVLPENVKYISIDGFCSSNIQSITLNKNLKYVSYYSFGDCNALIEVYNLSSVKLGKYSSTLIYRYATEVYTSEDTPSKIKEDANGFQFYADSDEEIYLCGYTGDQTIITLPDSYYGKNYQVKRFAFYGSSLEEVTISSGVDSLGDYAFCASPSLRKVVISDSVTSVGKYCFASCTELSFVVVGEKANVKEKSFDCCFSLQTIVIRNKNIVIEGYVFFEIENPLNIYYYGDAITWKTCDISVTFNEAFTDGKVYFYLESEPSLNEEGTAYDGNYWHYAEDGITPVEWVKA